MKKCINIIMTIFVIVILKGCIMVPVYLCIAPIVTAISWGSLRYLMNATRFEIMCVWHNIRDEWRMGCDAMVFKLA